MEQTFLFFSLAICLGIIWLVNALFNTERRDRLDAAEKVIATDPKRAGKMAELELERIKAQRALAAAGVIGLLILILLLS